MHLREVAAAGRFEAKRTARFDVAKHLAVELREMLERIRTAPHGGEIVPHEQLVAHVQLPLPRTPTCPPFDL